MNTSSMLITLDAPLNASKQVLNNRNKNKQAITDKALDKVQVVKTKVIAVYDTFNKGDKVSATMYTGLLKYLLIAIESSDKISSFKNKEEAKNRLV